jgi:tetratricopeptide (TPR) repeat protein
LKGCELGTEDWYRTKVWNSAAQQAFMARLGRSRSEFHKAQYLRIQAYELVNKISTPLIDEALELLNLLITQYPDKSQLSTAYSQQGKCYLALKQDILALKSIEMALLAQRNYPKSKGDAYQDFAELVLKLKLVDRYGEALELLDEFGNYDLFPIMKYRTARAKALIHSELGTIELAKVFARQAIEAANMSESPFILHKKLGLVHTPDSEMHSRLEQLCG